LPSARRSTDGRLSTAYRFPAGPPGLDRLPHPGRLPDAWPPAACWPLVIPGRTADSWPNCLVVLTACRLAACRLPPPDSWPAALVGRPL